MLDFAKHTEFAFTKGFKIGIFSYILYEKILIYTTLVKYADFLYLFSFHLRKNKLDARSDVYIV